MPILASDAKTISLEVDSVQAHFPVKSSVPRLITKPSTAKRPFQVSNVDDGVIHWVNGDGVTHIVRSLDGLQLMA